MARKKSQLAGIQYVGEPGVTAPCKQAVIRHILCGDRITSARILSCNGSHCLLLKVDEYFLIAVKSGFSSGYAGEGPSGLSYVLSLLDAHGAELDESDVPHELLDRLDASALTTEDLELVETGTPVRPTRLYKYIGEMHDRWQSRGYLWRDFPDVIPLSIVDPRIADLAISFWNAPDERLLTAYRRLEDTVRQRSGLDEHGSRLFSQAFLGTESKLRWAIEDSGEHAARANLFISAYGAFRNPRAHREPKDTSADQLAEFVLVNQLFRLEALAVPRTAAPS